MYGNLKMTFDYWTVKLPLTGLEVGNKIKFKREVSDNVFFDYFRLKGKKIYCYRAEMDIIL